MIRSNPSTLIKEQQPALFVILLSLLLHSMVLVKITLSNRSCLITWLRAVLFIRPKIVRRERIKIKMKSRKQNNKAVQVHHYDAVSYTTVLQRNLALVWWKKVLKYLREGPPEDHPTISEGRRGKFFFRFYCLKW